MPTDQPPAPNAGDDLLDPPAPPRPDDVVDTPTRKRRFPFTRSDGDRYLAGIAGGEGHRLGVDPFFLRIGLVGATLLLARNGGGGFVMPLVAYLAAWFLVPDGSGRSLLRSIRQRPAQQEMLGALALLILSVVVLSRPSLIWAGILLAAAVMLLSKRPPRPDEPLEQAGADPVAVTVAVTAEDRAVSWGRSLRGAVGPRPQLRPRRAPRPERPRRSPALWPLTISLLFAYGFGCVLIDNLVDPGIDPGIAVNGAILIVGAVIVLSGWRGRALATSVLLLPLIPAWIAFSVADTPRFAEIEASGSEGPYVDGQIIEKSKGYGGLALYLAQDDLPEAGQIEARVELTAGQADIWVPKEADLTIVGHIGLGTVQVYEESNWYANTGEPLVDYGLDRSFDAVGRVCNQFVVGEQDLRNAADWSGVAIPTDATGDEVADAIEAAGYPRPTSDIVTAYGPYDEVDGELVYDPETGLEETGSYQRVEWTFQANDNFGLCLPEAPPAQPVHITIDATIGLGNLKVHRV